MYISPVACEINSSVYESMISDAITRPISGINVTVTEIMPSMNVIMSIRIVYDRYLSHPIFVIFFIILFILNASNRSPVSASLARAISRSSMLNM